MKTIYLIWKKPGYNGKPPDWQEINGQEFLNLVRSSKGKNRYFIKLQSTDHDESDGEIIMEASKADYLDWRREKNRAVYLQRYSKNVDVASYHAMGDADDEILGEEMLIDCESDVESQFDKSHDLNMALGILTAREQHLIEFLYLSEGHKTICAYEEETGIPKSTINYRKKAILSKLKKYFFG